MDLTEDNFQEFALSHYISPQVCQDEFWVDLQRVTFFLESVKRFKPQKDPRLMINQFIILLNTFEPEGLSKILVFKSETKYLSRLKSVLLCFGIWRQDIIPSNIEPDHELTMAINNDFENWRQKNG